MKGESTSRSPPGGDGKKKERNKEDINMWNKEKWKERACIQTHTHTHIHTSDGPVANDSVEQTNPGGERRELIPKTK